MKYESVILNRLIETYGVVGNPRYISEIIKEFIVQGKECYPNLFTYQSDWLAHIDEFGLNPSYMVSYTGQSIYAPNTLESPVKSAILTGQTLVNIAPNMTQSSLTANTRPWKFVGSGKVVGSVSDNKLKISTTIDGSMIVNGEVPNTMKPSTKYYVQVEVKNNSDHNLYFYKVSTQSINLTTGLNKFIITTVNDFNVNHMGIAMGNSGGVNSGTEFEFSNLMIIEYQEGMENWDIPYFEGMKSVQMPVLTVTGKNLFNGEVRKGYYSGGEFKSNDANIANVTPVKIKPNTSYVISSDGNAKTTYYDNNMNFISYHATNSTTSPENASFMNFHAQYATYFQLEEGSTATSYEPFKSNILTVNEDVELRGIKDVRDTLDCLTGEMVEYIGEIVLDGSESWNRYGVNDEQLTQSFYISLPTSTNKNFISNKLPSVINANNVNIDYDCFGIYNNYLQLRISKSKLSSNDVNGLKTYLQSNPITVQYELATESIKTVDLSILDQNGQNVKQLMSFNGGTHFNTKSSEGSPLPTVSVSVETDLEKTLMVCSLEGNTM